MILEAPQTAVRHFRAVGYTSAGFPWAAEKRARADRQVMMAQGPRRGWGMRKTHRNSKSGSERSVGSSPTTRTIGFKRIDVHIVSIIHPIRWAYPPDSKRHVRDRLRPIAKPFLRHESGRGLIDYPHSAAPRRKQSCHSQDLPWCAGVATAVSMVDPCTEAADEI